MSRPPLVLLFDEAHAGAIEGRHHLARLMTNDHADTFGAGRQGGSKYVIPQRPAGKSVQHL